MLELVPQRFDWFPEVQLVPGCLTGSHRFDWFPEAGLVPRGWTGLGLKAGWAQFEGRLGLV